MTVAGARRLFDACMMQTRFALGAACSGKPATLVPHKRTSSTNRGHAGGLVAAATGAAGAAGAAEDWGSFRKTPSLETILSKMRHAVRPVELARSNSNAMTFGVGTHMGCQVSWTFIWRPGDGAFYEEVRSPDLTYKWGYDGGANSQCWEVDPSGVSKVLEKDDHEASLLGGLIKSGAWLVPELAEQRLEIWLEKPPKTSAEHWELDTPEMPPVATTISSSSSSSSSSLPSRGGATAAAAVPQPPPSAGDGNSSSSWDGEQEQVLGGGQQQPLLQQVARQQQQLGSLLLQQQQQSASGTAGGRRRGSSSSSHGAAGGPVVAASGLQQRDGMAFPDSHLPLILTAPYPTYYVALRLKGGRMLARVRVNGVSFHPEGYSHPLCSDTEVWRYQDWRHWSHVPGLPSVHFPLHVEHELFEGCCHRYETLGGKLRGPEIHKAYALPASPPVPIDAQFMDTYSQRVPMWQTVQGHLLVEAHLNGRRAGWMILDTGASGFVIEPAVADQFKLPRFGNLRIAGVAGKVKTQFRRASQLRIGPLSLSDPVMMEMKIGRLVRHFHDRVIGIAGFDVFRRCRITLPCTLTRRAILKAHSYNGKVMPTVQGNNDHAHLAALWPGGSSSSSSDAAAVKNLQTVQQVQQHVAQVNHAADAASSACPAAAGGAAAAAADNSSSRRRGSSSAKAAVASVESTSSSSSSSSATATPEAPGRRRRRESSSSVGSSSRRKTRSAAATAAAAAAAPAAADAEHTAAASGSRQQQLQQQPQSPQQQQPLRQLERVEVPPLLAQERLLARPADNYLVELLVQRPLLIRGPSELEDGYVWQELIMIASLPHVSLEFVAPRTGLRHESLFLVDTGAGGTEVMFHSRAAKELQLLVPPEELPGWAEPVLPGQQTERYVSGVGSDGETGAKAQGGVAVQTGKLPELVIRGQAGGDPGAQGSLLLREVKALFSTSGGLDISLYSAGMICVDLLSRMQVVLDYPNKRIGWKVPVPAPSTAAAAAGTTSSS